jgi:hypothetical protein
MWEVRAADGRLADLVAYASAHADPAAQVFRSDGTDPRVVLIDPTCRGLPDVPDELIARPPHEWHFEAVTRGG